MLCLYWSGLGSRPEPRAFVLRPILPPSLKEVLLIAETGGGTQQESISLCMPIVNSLRENVPMNNIFHQIFK